MEYNSLSYIPKKVMCLNINVETLGDLSDLVDIDYSQT